MFLLLANEANCQFLLWHTSWFLIQILCDSIGISSSSRTSHSRVAVAALLLICRQVCGGPVEQNSLPRILQDAQQRHTLMSGTILGKESDFLQTRNTLKYFSKDQKASWQGTTAIDFYTSSFLESCCCKYWYTWIKVSYICIFQIWGLYLTNW